MPCPPGDATNHRPIKRGDYLANRTPRRAPPAAAAGTRASGRRRGRERRTRERETNAPRHDGDIASLSVGGGSGGGAAGSIALLRREGVAEVEVEADADELIKHGEVGPPGGG